MEDRWVSPRQAADLTGLTPHGVRHRLRRDAQDLIANGMVRHTPAGYDGGRERWEMRTTLLQQWLTTDTDDGGAHAEELDMLRRETQAFELALEQSRGENEAAILRAERDALRSERDALSTQVANLQNRLKSLGESYAAAVLALTASETAAQ